MKRPSPEQRAAKAQALKARKEAVQQQLRQRRALGGRGPDKNKQRRRVGIAALIALVLLLIWLCQCEPPEEPEPEPQPALPAAPAEPELPVEEPEVVPPRKRLRGKIERRDRPEFQGKPPSPMPWLAAFRLQVSARSPRLAACFIGTERPGRLKWSTAVQPDEGVVADHVLEPMLLSQELTSAQRECVLGVLSAPSYELKTTDVPVTPSRVSLVIEF